MRSPIHLRVMITRIHNLIVQTGEVCLQEWPEKLGLSLNDGATCGLLDHRDMILEVINHCIDWLVLLSLALFTCGCGILMAMKMGHCFILHGLSDEHRERAQVGIIWVLLIKL